MTRRPPALLPMVISVAVALGMLALAPLFTAPVLTTNLMLTVGVPGLLAAVTSLLKLRRGWTILLPLIAGGCLLCWLGSSTAGSTDPLRAVPGLFTTGVQVLRESRPPMPDNPALSWLLLLFAFTLWLISYLLADALEQPAWTLAPLALPYGIAALVHPADLSVTGFLLVAAGYTAVLLTAGGPGLTGGGAGFQSARGITGLLAAALAAALTLSVTSALPMGQKQPWLNNGSDKPIQLSDPTIELSRNLQRPTPVDVLSYRANDGKPHYLRTTALTRLTTEGAQLESMRLRASGLAEAYDSPGTRVEVDVSMRFPSQYLPAPFAVEGFDAQGNWGFDQNTLSVVATGNEGPAQTSNLDYQVTSVVPEAGSAVAGARAGTDPGGGETLKVPDGLSDDVRSLTERITQNAASDGAKAQAIEAYLNSDEFTYTLQAPTSSGADAVSTCLWQDRAGYCIHYATSMAVMARILGIPSRIAIGFTSGTPAGDRYQVTTDNMHAWPELYFEGLGWVPFEPTKSIGASSSDSGTSSAPPSSAPSTSPIPEPSDEASQTQPAPPSSAPAAPSPSPKSPETQTPGSGGTRNAAGLLWLLPVVLLLAAPAGIRLALRLWRLRTGQPPVAAPAAAWRELAAVYTDLGLDFATGSPVAAAKAMGQTLPPATAGHLIEVAEVVQRSQFARQSPAVDQLPAQVKQLSRELRLGIPRLKRLLATMLPASLWRRGGRAR